MLQVLEKLKFYIEDRKLAIGDITHEVKGYERRLEREEERKERLDAKEARKNL